MVLAFGLFYYSAELTPLLVEGHLLLLPCILLELVSHSLFEQRVGVARVVLLL